VLRELGGQVYEVLRVDEDRVRPDVPRPLDKRVRVRARRRLRPSLEVKDTVPCISIQDRRKLWSATR